MVLNSKKDFCLIRSKISVGIHRTKSWFWFLEILWVFLRFFWKSDFIFGISTKSPIRFSVVVLHTGLKSFFLVFTRIFGYFWLWKILAMTYWFLIRNYTNQSIIENFDQPTTTSQKEINSQTKIPKITIIAHSKKKFFFLQSNIYLAPHYNWKSVLVIIFFIILNLLACPVSCGLCNPLKKNLDREKSPTNETNIEKSNFVDDFLNNSLSINTTTPAMKQEEKIPELGSDFWDMVYQLSMLTHTPSITEIIPTRTPLTTTEKATDAISAKASEAATQVKSVKAEPKLSLIEEAIQNISLGSKNVEASTKVTSSSSATSIKKATSDQQTLSIFDKSTARMNSTKRISAEKLTSLLTKPSLTTTAEKRRTTTTEEENLPFVEDSGDYFWQAPTTSKKKPITSTLTTTKQILHVTDTPGDRLPFVEETNEFLWLIAPSTGKQSSMSSSSSSTNPTKTTTKPPKTTQRLPTWLRPNDDQLLFFERPPKDFNPQFVVDLAAVTQTSSTPESSTHSLSTRASCADFNADICHYFANLNFCSPFYYANSLPMTISCARSCGLCREDELDWPQTRWMECEWNEVIIKNSLGDDSECVCKFFDF